MELTPDQKNPVLVLTRHIASQPFPLTAGWNENDSIFHSGDTFFARMLTILVKGDFLKKNWTENKT